MYTEWIIDVEGIIPVEWIKMRESIINAEWINHQESNKPLKWNYYNRKYYSSRMNYGDWKVLQHSNELYSVIGTWKKNELRWKKVIWT